MLSFSLANGLAVALALFHTSAAAQVAKRDDAYAPGYSSASYSTQCYTNTVSNPPKSVSTDWRTVTTSCSASTSTVTSVVTGSGAVNTNYPVTTITLTATAPIATGAGTVHVTARTVLVSTVMGSASVVVVRTASTTTVAASAGFIPVQTSLPGSSDKQSARKVRRADEKTSPNPQSNANYLAPSSGPGEVCCYVYKGDCSAVTTTVTQTAPGYTVAPTGMLTVTAYVTPGASSVAAVSASTYNTVITSVSTVTVFPSATTSTSFTTTSTVYGACATNNMASYINNVPIDNFDVANGSPHYPTGISNVYDCCVGALSYPFAELYVWDISSSTCIYVLANSCSTGQLSGGAGNKAYYGTMMSPFTLGNSYCGKWDQEAADTQTTVQS